MSRHAGSTPPPSTCLCAPGKPTLTRPGTPEKMLVMQERAARGEAIFHRGDSDRCGRIPRESCNPLLRSLPLGVTRCGHKYRARLWDPTRGKFVSHGVYATAALAKAAIAAAQALRT